MSIPTPAPARDPGPTGRLTALRRRGGATGRLTALRRRGGEDSGVVVVLVAILLTVILGSAALAIDLGSFYHAQRQAQAAADAGALAAAQDLGGSGAANYANDGTTFALTNYPGATATVSQPTTNEAKVTVNAISPSFLGSALGLANAHISATAVAGVTGTSMKCSNPGKGCYAIFAMNQSCTTNPVNFNGSGNTINGGVWSNGSINVGGGNSSFGPTTYGNGSGCSVSPSSYAQQDSFTSGPTPSAPQTTWPLDYSKDFPDCGGAGELACTGPCDVSASPCPAANRTPSFCTQATNAASETLVAGSTLFSGNIYCDIGSGSASQPSTWTGAITLQQSSGTMIESTYVGGSFSVNGSGAQLEACGYAPSGYSASGCSPAVPAPVTANYPLVYVAGSGSSFTLSGGGSSLTGDVFAPNGNVTFNGGGASFVGFIEGQNVVWNGGAMTGDGPAAGSIGSASGGTISLLQ